MILLDLGRKRSEIKYFWTSKLAALIYLICCGLKAFSETERSMIVIGLVDEGLGIVKEGMVVASW